MPYDRLLLSTRLCDSSSSIPFPATNTIIKRSGGSSSVQCAATMGTAPKEAETKKKSMFDLQTLTTWLLKQEQAGSIDVELTIVLSSISMACKHITALLQRANISNLTGVQGAVKVQGEDQKKLDVVSNEA